ncbi:hypothetical protein Pint_28791 [Pistacia integerrima]|uniref:Uncharacterized protein n=1 Tax=Pistacia integerrima TaxID=434235 RepID=A0ACC0WX33_9ROSI|nr:hypothetical protein Pint_28791 [Pistacia integerrima]
MTNNFEMVLGKGGFGTVYHGYLDDTQVAVKNQLKDTRNFKPRIHHKTLTALVGYCDEGTNMELIYVFMANGNIETNLSENQAHMLTWEGRLRRATEAAQGKPMIEKSIKRTHISRWVESMVSKADIRKIVDPRLPRDFDINSA